MLVGAGPFDIQLTEFVFKYTNMFFSPAIYSKKVALLPFISHQVS